MINRNASLVLVFGATGKSGFHIANALIDQGFAVRVLVRSKQKVTRLFKEKEISFERIIEGKINDENLKIAFQPSSTYGNIKYVVSALGASSDSGQSVQTIQYLTQVKIIEKCKQKSVQKYIFITAMLMQRPWHPITVLLNTIVPSVYHWKAKAENYLRKSGINYIIIRPPGLVGDQSNTKTTDYVIDQGDKVNGQITRCTLGNVVCDCIEAKDIPQKVTFQCMGLKGQKKGNELKFGQLKPDTEKSIVTANHKLPKIVYGLFLLSGIIFGVYYFMGGNKENTQLKM